MVKGRARGLGGPATRVAWRLSAFAVACVVLVPRPGRAQEFVSFEQLRAELEAGDELVAERLDGTQLKGRLTYFGEVELQVEDDTLQQWTLAELRRIERRPDRLSDGAMWGALAGAAFPIGMTIYLSAVDRNEADEWGAAMAVFIGAGAGVGAGIGALVDRSRSKPALVWQRDDVTVGVDTSAVAFARGGRLPGRAGLVRVTVAF